MADWKNLITKDVSKVEEFIVKADIGDVIFTLNDGQVMSVLFVCLEKFVDNQKIQCRSLQLLQDCHILSKGIPNDELAKRFDTFATTLSIWINNVDVVLNLFQLLAMVADRDAVKNRVCKTEETPLLEFIERAMRLHSASKPIQRSGLQLFEEIMKNSKQQEILSISAQVFKLVLDNLLLHTDDASICYASFSILGNLADQREAVALLSPWMEQILNITMNTISQLYSEEITANCLLLLEKLVQDPANLIIVASHEHGLVALVEAIGKLTPKHVHAATIAWRILQVSLEDPNVLTMILSNPVDMLKMFFETMLSELNEKFDNFIAQANDSPVEVNEEEMQQFFIVYHEIIEVVKDLQSQPIASHITEEVLDEEFLKEPQVLQAFGLASDNVLVDNVITVEAIEPTASLDQYNNNNIDNSNNNQVQVQNLNNSSMENIGVVLAESSISSNAISSEPMMASAIYIQPISKSNNNQHHKQQQLVVEDDPSYIMSEEEYYEQLRIEEKIRQMNSNSGHQQQPQYNNYNKNQQNNNRDDDVDATPIDDVMARYMEYLNTEGAQTNNDRLNSQSMSPRADHNSSSFLDKNNNNNNSNNTKQQQQQSQKDIERKENEDTLLPPVPLYDEVMKSHSGSFISSPATNNNQNNHSGSISGNNNNNAKVISPKNSMIKISTVSEPVVVNSNNNRTPQSSSQAPPPSSSASTTVITPSSIKKLEGKKPSFQDIQIPVLSTKSLSNSNVFNAPDKIATANSHVNSKGSASLASSSIDNSINSSNNNNTVNSSTLLTPIKETDTTTVSATPTSSTPTIESGNVAAVTATATSSSQQSMSMRDRLKNRLQTIKNHTSSSSTPTSNIINNTTEGGLSQNINSNDNSQASISLASHSNSTANVLTANNNNNTTSELPVLHPIASIPQQPVILEATTIAATMNDIFNKPVANEVDVAPTTGIAEFDTKNNDTNDNYNNNENSNVISPIEELVQNVTDEEVTIAISPITPPPSKSNKSAVSTKVNNTTTNKPLANKTAATVGAKRNLSTANVSPMKPTTATNNNNVNKSKSAGNISQQQQQQVANSITDKKPSLASGNAKNTSTKQLQQQAPVSIPNKGVNASNKLTLEVGSGDVGDTITKQPNSSPRSSSSSRNSELTSHQLSSPPPPPPPAIDTITSQPGINSANLKSVGSFPKVEPVAVTNKTAAAAVSTKSQQTSFLQQQSPVKPTATTQSTLNALNLTEEDILNLIMSTQHAQQQAALAMSRSNAMHALFLESAKKMEDLVKENDQLWNRVCMAEERQFRLSQNNSPYSSIEEDEDDDDEVNDNNNDLEGDLDLEEQQEPENDNDADEANQQQQQRQKQSQSVKIKKDNNRIQHQQHNRSKSEPLHISDLQQGQDHRHSNESKSNNNHNSSSDNNITRNDDGVEGGPSLKKHPYLKSRRQSYLHTPDHKPDIYKQQQQNQQHQHRGKSPKPDTRALVTCQLSLAVAGTVEALEQTEFTALSTSPSAKQQQNDGTNTVTDLYSKEAMSIIELFSQHIQSLFDTIKSTVYYEYGNINQSKYPSSINILTIKQCLRKIGFIDDQSFKLSDVDILCSQLNVQQVSLFGIAYVIVIAGKKRYQNIPYYELLPILQEHIVDYTQYLQQEHARVMSQSSSNPIEMPTFMTKLEFEELLKLLDREQKAFVTIYENYAPSVNSRLTPLNSNNPSTITSLFEQHIQRNRLSKAAISLLECSRNTYQTGMSLAHVMQFAKDFQINPDFLSKSQLGTLFQLILRTESKSTMELNEDEANNATPNSDELISDNSIFNELYFDFNNNSSSSNNKLADTRKKSIGFLQFLDLIVLIATRSPVFQGNNSVIVKISNLLLLLNRSGGKERIAEKSRSSTLVVFKVNPLMLQTPAISNNNNNSYNNTAASSSANSPFVSSNNRNNNNYYDASIGNNVLTSPQSLAQTQPYYDPVTTSIVQGKKKKNIQELRSLISGSSNNNNSDQL